MQFHIAGGRLLFGTDTGFLTDYDMSEEYRQLELAGLSFRGCPLHAYDQSGGRVQCLLSRGFGETRRRRRPNGPLCRPCCRRPAKFRSRALCHPRRKSDFRGASPALSCLSRNPLELALYSTPKIAALPLCGLWAAILMTPESRATRKLSKLATRFRTDKHANPVNVQTLTEADGKVGWGSWIDVGLSGGSRRGEKRWKFFSVAMSRNPRQPLMQTSAPRCYR